MGLMKILLKAILIPIVIIVVIIVVIGILIKTRRDRKKEEKQVQQRGFHPPPITQWNYPEQVYPDPVQKPAPVAYPVAATSYLATPSQMEAGYTHA
ncbi:hypothetical protein N7486_002374 [Penicillium sp. IBT 16267x]|nr:hypothetical protein N7486_002374 [Penicillium sp. IBT 16267x]